MSSFIFLLFVIVRIDGYLMILLFIGTTKMTKKYLEKPYGGGEDQYDCPSQVGGLIHIKFEVTSDYRSNPH
jgi:hypothetical protein